MASFSKKISMLESLKNIARPYYNSYRASKQLALFKKHLAMHQGGALKVVVGSSGIFQEGWIPSEAHILDLLQPKSWKTYFQEESLDAIIGEHVWEHLTMEQGLIAAKTCFQYLKKGGYARIAVPDGLHPDSEYIDYVKIGGHGAGADDHKVLYTYKTLSEVFEKAGFKVTALEYFDEQGIFQKKNWDTEQGYVKRTIRLDERNIDGKPVYTSILIDAVKP